MTLLWAPAPPLDSPLPPTLAIHGGAGARPALLSEPEKAEHHRVLRVSLAAGKAVLDAGGPALDAVTAAVLVLEDSALFNAAHGAALNADAVAELDAAVMTGDGRAGTVIGSTRARNPVLVAGAVRERTDHVTLLDPSPQQLGDWALEVVDPDYFVTPHRVEQVRALQDAALLGPRHGTVGAVARDGTGAVAAATSTGGTANQMRGRVGDSPLIGAGTWADDATVAISCTGHGEHFMRQVFAHEVHDRMALAGLGLADAVAASMADLAARGGRGGLIAVDRAGNTLLTYNTEGMFSGYLEDGEIITHV
jgi:L-asparaginase / beta-aspartyl-peptidase